MSSYIKAKLLGLYKFKILTKAISIFASAYVSLRSVLTMGDKFSPDFRLVLTEPNTITVVTGAGAYVYDKKTGKLIAFYPEMGDPVYYKHAEIIKAVNVVMDAIEGIKELEVLRANAAKTLESSVDVLMKSTETRIKSKASTQYTEEEISRLNPQPEPPHEIRHTVVVVKR
jgi:hypothetical protein